MSLVLSVVKMLIAVVAYELFAVKHILHLWRRLLHYDVVSA
jgi:hypothetical protein